MKVIVTEHETIKAKITENRAVYHIADFDTSVGAVRKLMYPYKGDIVAGTGSNEVGTVHLGTAVDGYVLMVDLTKDTGLAFKPASGGVNVQMKNASGVDVIAGDVLVFNTTESTSFTVTNIYNDLRTFGVAKENINAGATGAVDSVAGNIVTVNCDTAAVEIGDFLVSSSTTKKATSAGKFKTRGVFAIALSSKSSGSAGQVSAMIFHGFERAIGGTYGWAIGGSNGSGISYDDVQRFTMATGTWANVSSATMPTATRANCGLGNTTICAYSIGGLQSSTYVSTGYKMPYSTEVTTAVSSLNLPAVRAWTGPGGANAYSAGYPLGGYNGSAYSSATYKTTYATDTTSTLSTTLSAVRGYMVSSSDGSKIFIVGGYNGSAAVGTCDMMDVATDTCTNNASGAVGAAYTYVSLSFPTTAGYFVYKEGATSYSYKIPYTTNVSATIGSAPASDHRYGIGVGDNNNLGWVSGDDAPSANTDAFNKTTETYSTDSGAALALAKCQAAYMTNGAY